MLSEIRQIIALKATVNAQSDTWLLDEIDIIGSSLRENFVEPSLFCTLAIRFFDVITSLLALLLLSPLLLVTFIAIRAETPGEAIFSQLRWGKNNTKIHILKFRSMHQHLSDEAGSKQARENDKRITKVGRFIRRSSVDELPQLCNVIVGRMSLVGPRVHPLKMYAAGSLYEEFSQHYMTRHLVRPGITGLAQCIGYRGETTDKKAAAARLFLDLFFVQNFSFRLYLAIIVYTLIKGMGLRM
jgi:lipopolysaccharide/colanic/teichoic acid biosynthesis glycosyltransferase